MARDKQDRRWRAQRTLAGWLFAGVSAFAAAAVAVAWTALALFLALIAASILGGVWLISPPNNQTYGAR